MWMEAITNYSSIYTAVILTVVQVHDAVDGVSSDRDAAYLD